MTGCHAGEYGTKWDLMVQSFQGLLVIWQARRRKHCVLSNLLREIFSFFSIPWISKKLNYYTCIAPAGATSEDTTLPMMIRYTNEETVVLSVFNGVICSALVPFLISFCYNIF